jgi:hypothetical protein
MRQILPIATAVFVLTATSPVVPTNAPTQNPAWHQLVGCEEAATPPVVPANAPTQVYSTKFVGWEEGVTQRVRV